MNNLLLKTAMVCGLVLLSCKQQQTNKHKDSVSTTKKVIASNYPLQFFTQKIVGDFAAVSLLAPKDIDPAFWKPSTNDIIKIQEANLLVLNGAGYESWLNTVSIPEAIQLNTSNGFINKLITSEKELTHTHGAGAKHSHQEIAFTVWLNIDLAIKQAKAIKDKCKILFPGHSEDFDKNFRSLKKELIRLDESLAEISKKMDGKKLLFSHPVYQYFQNAYSIKGLSLHWEPTIPISNTMWHDLEHLHKENPFEWIVWENRPLESSVKKLEKIGIQSIIFNPCGNKPAVGDFFSVMNENIEQLSKIVAAN